MTDTNSAPVADVAPIADIPAHTPAGEGPLSVREATNSLIDWRNKRNKPDNPAEAKGAETTPPAKPETESTEVETAAPDNQAPGDEQPEAIDPPAETPEPIEPPRSWTKDEKDRFKTLPRETQEYLAKREQEREREVRRSQNEAAEKSKGLTAKEQAAEETRRKYEEALPQLLAVLQNQQSGEFSDIRTMDDAARLAQNDPLRYIQFQAHQQKVSAVQAELNRTQQRQQQEHETRWNEWSKREDSLFIEKVPEMANTEQAQKLGNLAISTLKELGFEDGELNNLWNGKASISVRDHRFQQLALKAAQYDEAKKNAKVAPSKAPPPVQRPGVAQPKGAVAGARIQALEAKFQKSGSLKDAVALRAARTAAR